MESLSAKCAEASTRGGGGNPFPIFLNFKPEITEFSVKKCIIRVTMSPRFWTTTKRECSIMKQLIKIIRKVDIVEQHKQVLHLEKDYELSSLFDALQTGDEREIQRSKQRLKEIVDDLAGLDSDE